MNFQTRLFFITLLFLQSSVYGFQVAPAQINKQELTKTMQGETILKELKLPKGKVAGKIFSAVTMMDASISQVYQLISDFKRYPDFMPDIDHIVMLEEHDNSAKVTFILGLPLGKVKKYRIESTFENNGDSAFLKWHKFPWKGVSKEETIEDTEGYWYLSEHPLDRAKTLVKYIVYSDPGEVPFGFGWIVDYMTKKSLPSVFSNTKEKLQENKRKESA